MKVILLSDVKNVGKKDEVVEVADGYARNFLIKRKLAVAQTQGSMQVLGRQQEEARLREEELEKEAQKTKERLEKIVLECQIKTGNGGRSFGSISTKQIAEQLAKEHDIHIDQMCIRDRCAGPGAECAAEHALCPAQRAGRQCQSGGHPP